MTPSIDLSVIVPIFSEEAALPALLDRTIAALDALGRPYEIIFVDDGSRDRSLELLRQRQEKTSSIRIVRLSRNFGLQSAVCAGLAHAKGDLVGLMDGDLQDPPELFGEMLAKIDEGHDVVHMIKRSRAEGGAKRLGFNAFYWLFSKLSATPLPATAGLFSLMRRRVVTAILDLPERNKFVPGLRTWVGFSQAELSFDRAARHAGTPSQSWSRLVRLALDALYSFTDVPLKLALLLGGGSASLALLAIVIVSGLRIFTDLAISGWASTLVAIFFMGGVQLICVGLLGEYISRIYDEVRRRPQFVVDEVIEPPATTSAD